MPIRDHFPATLAVYRALTGRIARRIYTAILLTPLLTTTVIRVHTYLLTRKFQAVLRGLSKIQIDQTTEAEIPHLVPYLTRNSVEIPVGPNRESPNVDAGVEHFYSFVLSNDDEWIRLVRFAQKFSRLFESGAPFDPDRSWIYTVTDWLGYRNIHLYAGIVTLNGRVSSFRYHISNEFVMPRQFGDIVSASSIHGRWAPYAELRIDSATEENPQFIVGGSDQAIHAAFTPDAPPALRNHIFQISLRCLWSFTPCRHPVQVAPVLWRDKQEAEQRAFARLTSDNPCPDSLVASRIRYTPDLRIVLLESTGLPANPSTPVNYGNPANQLQNHYKLIELLLGPAYNWGHAYSDPYVADPRDFHHVILNRSPAWRPSGERVLLFLGPTFASCQLISATPAAIDAGRNTSPGAKRIEDMVLRGFL